MIMKEYFFNCLVSFLTCLFLAILTFLVARDGGPSAVAICCGIVYGIIGAVAYCLGGLMNEDDSTFNGSRFFAMAVSGVIGGIIGGVVIGIG